MIDWLRPVGSTELEAMELGVNDVDGSGVRGEERDSALYGARDLDGTRLAAFSVRPARA